MAATSIWRLFAHCLGCSKVDPTRHQTGFPGLLIQALRQLMPRGLPLERLEDVDLKMFQIVSAFLTHWHDWHPLIWFRNVRCTCENVLYNGFGLWDALVWLQQRNENKASSRSSKILQQGHKQQEPRDHTPMQRSTHFTIWTCPNICHSDSKKHTGVPTFAYWGFEHVWALLRQIWSWKAVMTYTAGGLREDLSVPSPGEMVKFVQTLRTPRFRKTHTSTETWLILANMRTPYRCRRCRKCGCGLECWSGLSVSGDWHCWNMLGCKDDCKQPIETVR